MDIEDDDAFLYGDESPPPTAPAVAETPKVEPTAKAEVTPNRSSFPLVMSAYLTS
jgi:hypothetical protein